MPTTIARRGRPGGGWVGRTGSAVLAAAVVAGLTAGCARSSSDEAAVTPAVAPGRATADAPVGGVPPAPEAGDDAGVTSGGATLRADALDAPAGQRGRSFVSTATMTVVVDDVAAVKARVVAVAEAAGGGLFAEQTTYGARSRSVITLKIPPGAFARALADIGALGSLASEEVKTDDVTAQVIDLDARITAAAASLERTRDLLSRAASLAEVSQMEDEVARRQADLESLRGQQRTLQDRIDLATVVVTLDGQHDVTPAVEEARREPEPAPLPGFGDGLGGGLAVAGAALSLAGAALGALIPFLPVVALAVLALRWWRRRRRVAGTGPEPAAAAA